MDEWKPIKTAPKNDINGFLVGRSRKAGVPAVAQVIAIDGKFLNIGVGEFCDPTHWMRLPKPPTEGDQQ